MIQTIRSLAVRWGAPINRLLPRGKGLLIRAIGADDRDDPRWQHLPRRMQVYYDHLIQAYMPVDLSLFYPRLQFFTGHAFDFMNALLIQDYLGEGDTFVDIGAHFGYFSICASKVVGAQGRVYAFEPHPRLFRALEACAAINGLTNIRAHNIALSDEDGVLPLTLAAADIPNPGKFTLRSVNEATGERISVPVRQGREVLADLPISRRTLVKIDVEGFEHQVLRGLGNVVHRPNLGFSVEITDRWLRETGSSATDLISDLMGLGLKMYRPIIRRGVFKPRLHLERIDRVPQGWQHDLVFLSDSFLTGRARHA